jgi:hypothetical protein
VIDPALDALVVGVTADANEISTTVSKAAFAWPKPEIGYE